MLKAWDFTSKKVCHRFFDNKIAENFLNKYS